MNIDKYIKESVAEYHALIHSEMREELYGKLRLLGAVPEPNPPEHFLINAHTTELALAHNKRLLFWYVKHHDRCLLNKETYAELINR